MPEVARAAGVSLRTVYRHFPSRDDLLAGASEWMGQNYFAMAELPDTLDWVVENITLNAKLWDEYPELGRALTENIHTKQMDVNRAWYGDDFCVVEHQWHGTVPGEFMGIAGNGRRISFRMLHVWEFKDGAMSRENVWLDTGSIIQQLNVPEADAVARA